MKKFILVLSVLVTTLLSSCTNLSTIDSIEVLEAKTEYTIGEDFDLSELILKADDLIISGSTSGVKISGFDSSTVGTRYLTITYKGVTATLSYEVKRAPVIVPNVGWVKDRTEPKSFVVQNDMVTLTVDGSKTTTGFERWQGYGIDTTGIMTETKSYWYVESSYVFDSLYLDERFMTSASFWVVVNDGTKIVGYPILSYGNVDGGNWDFDTFGELPTVKGWFAWHGKYKFMPVTYDEPQIGRYNIGMEFDNGMIKMYIDGTLVMAYSTTYTTSKVDRIIFNGLNFGQDYTLQMTLPKITW